MRTFGLQGGQIVMSSLPLLLGVPGTKESAAGGGSMLQNGKSDSSNCTLYFECNSTFRHCMPSVECPRATVPLKSITAQRHKSQYGRNPSGHCEIARTAIEPRGLLGEGVGRDASGARKLKLAYEISVRGAWTVGVGVTLNRAPANFLEAPEMAGARQQHTGWCTIRKEA